MSDFEPSSITSQSSASPPSDVTSLVPTESSSTVPTTEPSTEQPPTSTDPGTTQPPTSEPPTTTPPSSSSEPPIESSSSTTTPPPSPSASTTPPPSSSSSSPSATPSATPSSTVDTTSSTSPTTSFSVVIVPPSSSSPTVVTTPTGLFVTTDSAGSTITGSLSLSLTTDANGRTITVTQVIKGTPSLDGGSASRHGGSNFFDNTGAVAGVFVVVGLVVTAFLAAFTWFMLRRRRRQRLDRDVSAAAAAAAQATHPRFEDDDEPQMTQYADNSYYPNPAVDGRDDYLDRSGGVDRYAATMDIPVAGSGVHDRMSTATAPGMAGFGAGHAYHDAQADHPVDFTQADHQHSHGGPQYDVAHGYADVPHDDYPVTNYNGDYNAGYNGGYSDNYNSGYNGGYNGGYSYDDSPQHEQDAFAAPAAPVPVPRPESVGSVVSGANTNNRGLTVTNV